MKYIKNILVAASIVAISATSAFAQNDKSTNKEVVVAAMTGLFIARDVSVIDKYWSPSYTQHNPLVPNGSEVLKGFVPGMGSSFKYEPGMVIAEGDYVMMHGRYTGMAPKVMVGVDIFRLANGKIVEHWDVLQEETTKTASGNPMFTNPQK
jgi:predicted SnoaL-like aldol condensation-catalyzing enzyme